MKDLLALIFAAKTAAVCCQPITLNLASDVWPPFTDVEPHHAFALDLVQEALSRDSVKAHTNICVFKDVIDGINNQKFDGSAALWFTPERERTLLYSEPYLENRLILVGRKGAIVSARSLADLAGKRVAIVEGYAYGSLEDARKVKFLNGNNDQQNLERLLRGEVDYMLVDALLIEYLFKFQKEEADRYLEFGANTIIRAPLYFAIRREVAGADKIVEHFNEAIMQMIADGSYNRILHLNWLSSDVDGDGLPELVLSGENAGTDAPERSYDLSTYSSHNAVQVGRYVVNGNLYPTWESVPDKYKQPVPGVSEADKTNFGQVFKF